MPGKKRNDIHTLPADIEDCTAEEFANGLRFVSNGNNSVAAKFFTFGKNLCGTGFDIGEAYGSLLTEIANCARDEAKK